MSRLTRVVVLLLVAVTGLVATPAWAARGDAPAAPTHLSTNFLAAPMNVDPDHSVDLGWQLPAGYQAAYQVRLARDTGRGYDEAAEVWRSDRVKSSRSTDVAYDGPGLRPAERYLWQVRIWDGDGRPSAWSAPATVGTADVTGWHGASPIWASNPADAWTDYRLDLDMAVEANATGIKFRSPNLSNGYMWQFRADSASGDPDTLKPHVLVDGRYTALDPVPLGTRLEAGSEHHVTIEVAGDRITTWLDGRKIDQRTDDHFASGVIGFRNGRSERGRFDDVTVTRLADGGQGPVLYSNDFTSDKGDFSCGTVEGGALAVGNSGDCLVAGMTNDWALMRADVALDPGKTVAWASVFATASSPEPSRQFVYKLYLDGKFVGLGPTQSIGSETRFDGFDVTGQLVDGGEHVLSVIAHTTEDKRFLADLVVRYTDGSTDSFGTGRDWAATSGSAVWPSAGSIGTGYYAAPQEDFDARAYPYGFQRPGFADGDWSAAVVKDDFTQLAATPFAKVSQELHAPVKIVDKGNGDYFVDFGRTWVGGVHLTLHGDAGRQVRLQYGEELADPTTARYRMRTGNTYEDVVTLRDGTTTVDTWGMRVFRYLNIRNSPEPITAENLQALAQVYPFDRSASRFTSSDPSLVQVWRLSRNTIAALNHDFFVDSWTRERGAYEADAYLQQLANAYLTDDPTLSRYMTDYFQEHRTWPTEWPLYVVMSAYETWQQTGDTGQLRRDYATLQGKLLDRYYDPGRGIIYKTYRSDGCGSRTDCDIVDWPSSQRDGFVFSTQNTVINALAYKTYAEMSRIAGVLGKDDDASTYQERARRIRDSLNQRFYDARLGAYDDGRHWDDRPTGHHSVHASVFPTAFGVPTSKAQYDALGDFIAGKGMVCSVYCSGFLLEALYNADKGDAALGLLTSTGTSSWLNMIANGAGATSEAWDASQKSNMTWSHPWAAAPAYVIPRDMYGIEPTTPGYATFAVKPQPGDQQYGSVTVPTVKGTIGVAFEKVDGHVDVGVSVPGNTHATVSVPKAADTSDALLYVDGSATPARSEDGRLVVTVPAGCHTVTLSDDAAARRTDLSRTCSADLH